MSDVPLDPRERIARVLCKADGNLLWPAYLGKADAVLAALPPLVRALADDEALVERVAAGSLGPAAQMDDYTREGQSLLRGRAQRMIRALADALPTGRTDR